MKGAKFDFEDFVYLVVDGEQVQWMVTGMLVELGGCIKYRISNGYDTQFVYDKEITLEKIEPKITNGFKNNDYK